MQLSVHIEALLSDLTSVGSLGDEAVAQAAERLSDALKSSARLRLLDLLSDVTLEVSDQLPSGHVEIRLAGQEPSLVYVEERESAEPAAPEDGMSARISLRLPEALKAAIEAAAAREGLSANTWLVRELKRAVHRGSAHKSFGSGLTGFAEN
jgi:predicted DNA binding CopG/RHH family protein